MITWKCMQVRSHYQMLSLKTMRRLSSLRLHYLGSDREVVVQP